LELDPLDTAPVKGWDEPEEADEDDHEDDHDGGDDGLETLDRIAERGAAVPVIVLTGLDDEEIGLQVIHRGAQDYLPKGGFNEELLVRTIWHAVERTAAEQLVRVSEERYRNLFEQANEAVLVVSGGRILRANPMTEKLFGWTLDELTGRPFADLVYPDDLDLVLTRHRERMRGSDALQRYEFRVRAKNGETRWVEVSTARVDWEGQVAGLAMMNDISERKRLESRTDALLERQTAMNELTLALGATSAKHDVYRVLRQHVTQLIKNSAMLVCEFDRDRLELRPTYANIADKEVDVSDAAPVSLVQESEGLRDRVIRLGEPLLVSDCSEMCASRSNPCTICRRGITGPVADNPGSQESIVCSKLAVPLKAKGEVIGVLQLQSRLPNAFGQEDAVLLGGLANAAAIAIRNAQLIEEAHRQAERLTAAFDGIIRTVSAAAEMRDPYTAGHQQRVARLAAEIAETLGLDEETIEGVRVASLVHDIGKLGIPAEILSKPSQLTDTEFDIIKSHAESAYRILESIEFPWPIADTVYQHHERLDGSGYPRGLAGDEVSLEARIIGVADVVEAMASNRPYRPSLGLERALEEIEAHKGTKFDPQAVEACLALFKERGFSLDAPDGQ
ncbi:PAS domain S-box protein, partial [Candidatus Bipolaricaulota bacterium]|nr:PAS domain S-box protein [Candidatus Bipolaricaulota bacterium]